MCIQRNDVLIIFLLLLRHFADYVCKRYKYYPIIRLSEGTEMLIQIFYWTSG